MENGAKYVHSYVIQLKYVIRHVQNTRLQITVLMNVSYHPCKICNFYIRTRQQSLPCVEKVTNIDQDEIPKAK